MSHEMRKRLAESSASVVSYAAKLNGNLVFLDDSKAHTAELLKRLENATKDLRELFEEACRET